MASYNNMCAAANHRAVQKSNSLQAVTPCRAPNGIGWLVATYATKQGRGTIVGRIIAPSGMVIAYRVLMAKGKVITCNPNPSAIGSLYMPLAMATRLGYPVA